MSFTFPHGGRIRRCAGLGVIVALGCHAAAAEGERFIDVFAAVSSVQNPKVTEDSKSPSGTNTTYKWKGGADNGIEGMATVMTGRSRPSHAYGFEYGVDLLAARYNVTPNAYGVDGVTYLNSSSDKLTYYTSGVNIDVGWQYGIVDRDAIHGVFEFVPFVGGGLAHAKSDITFGGGVDHPASGYGYYFQYGARVAAYVTEKRWIAGILATYQGGMGSVSVSGDQGYSSDLTLKQQSIGLGALVGYRF